MTFHPVHAVTLVCHPETPAAAVHGIGARVGRAPGGVLAVTYVIEGDMDRLRVPALNSGGIGSRLWEHTCCEIFIARKGLPEYHEFNFSPSGEWAVHAFRRYRERAPLAGELDPQIAVRNGAGKLEVDVSIRLDRLSPAYLDATLALALSAVVENSDGTLSYWALRHPPGRPDFHHADAYVLEVAGTGPSPAQSSA